MTRASALGGLNRFSKRFDGSLARWVVLLVSLHMPSTASDEVDCRNVSGYTHGPVPDTCTAQLALNNTDKEMINSLKAKYKDFPHRCQLRKYTLYVFNAWVVRAGTIPNAFLDAQITTCIGFCDGEVPPSTFIPLLLSTGACWLLHPNLFFPKKNAILTNTTLIAAIILRSG